MNCSHDVLVERYGTEVARCYLIIKNKGKANISIDWIAGFCKEWNEARKEINNNAKQNRYFDSK